MLNQENYNSQTIIKRQIPNNIFNTYFISKSSMNNSARLLPRLDQLYTQKKSYQVHKNKILSIQRSNSMSRKSLTMSKINHNQDENKSQKSLTFDKLSERQTSVCHTGKDPTTQARMQTIQQTKPGISYWLKRMNPHQKRLKQQQIKQNKRIRQKIKNTMSFIVQKHDLNNHQQHYTGMKKMLSRFSIDENSQKTKLKCEIVLKKINELEKSKMKLQQSRLMAYESKSPPKRLTKENHHNSETKLNSYRQSSFITKRPKMLTQNITTMSNKHSTSNTKERPSLIKQPASLSLIRQKTDPRKRTQIPTIKQSFPTTFTNKPSQRYNRIKTEMIQRVSTNRNFNNSKLSNISSQTARQRINFSDYKMIKVNFSQTGTSGMKRTPSLQENRFDKPQNVPTTTKNQLQLKKYITQRIKTDNNQFIHTNKDKQPVLENRFDYQKKRIDRFLKSKTSLSTKKVTQNLTNYLNKNNEEITKQKENPTNDVEEQKNTSITKEELIERLATIEESNTLKLLNSKLKEKEKNIEPKQEQRQVPYFPTEIE